MLQRGSASAKRAVKTIRAGGVKGAPHAAGKEVVVRYGSSLRTGRRFATDANGREMQVQWCHSNHPVLL
jgi:hypothetical protein